MTKYTQLLIQKQFPQYFREEYQEFVRFISEYYRHLDSTSVGNLDKIIDIDSSDTVFLDHYRQQFAIEFPDFDNFALREFIKNAKRFYTSKGTEKSLKFLFRLLFNEDPNIDYPGRFSLRASDGKWNQEFFLTASTVEGFVPVAPFNIQFTNSFGTYFVEISRVEDISTLEYPNEFRLYFNYNIPIKFSDNQFVYSELVPIGSTVKWKALLKKSLQKLSIVDPGKYWQLGQIITFEGQNSNTFARVKKIDSEGGLRALEIIEFGYSHIENQIWTISPFPRKPLSSQVSYTKTLVTFDPLEYRHDLEIYEEVSTPSDSLVGIKNESPQEQIVFASETQFDININTAVKYVTQTGEDRYFLTDYLEESYMGTEVFEDYDDYGITIDQWLESRATIALQFDYLVKSRGFYVEERSLISNRSVRLQDNEYYQQFQYEIETSHDQREYESALMLTHPAGMKWFSSLNRAFSHVNDDPEIQTEKVDI